LARAGGNDARLAFLMSQAEKYTYGVQWSEQDGEFIGLCAEFLSWLAKKDDEAFAGIKKLVREVAGDVVGNKEPLPVGTAPQDEVERRK